MRKGFGVIYFFSSLLFAMFTDYPTVAAPQIEEVLEVGQPSPSLFNDEEKQDEEKQDEEKQDEEKQDEEKQDDGNKPDSSPLSLSTLLENATEREPLGFFRTEPYFGEIVSDDKLQSRRPGEPDNRVEFPSQEWPYTAIGLLILSFTHGEARGTGFLIGPCQVLTAAHNLYYNSELGKVTSVQFFPGGKEAEKGGGQGQVVPGAKEDKNGCLKGLGEHCFVPDEWIREPVVGSQFDFGLIVLEKSAPPEVGWIGLFAVHSLISKDDVTEWLESQTLTIPGYPGEKKNPALYGESGVLSKDPAKDRNQKIIKYSIATTDGQSGSPILVTTQNELSYAVGIHTTGFTTDFTNKGVYLSKAAFEQVLCWIDRCQLTKETLQQHSFFKKLEEKKNKEAFWKKEAEHNPLACIVLGDVYQEAENDEEAKRWYHKAIGLEGGATAWNSLGQLYQREGKDLEALECYRKGKEAGDLGAMVSLANRYEMRCGVELPEEVASLKAQTLYQEAEADLKASKKSQSDSLSMAHLGKVYFDLALFYSRQAAHKWDRIETKRSFLTLWPIRLSLSLGMKGFSYGLVSLFVAKGPLSNKDVKWWVDPAAHALGGALLNALERLASERWLEGLKKTQDDADGCYKKAMEFYRKAEQKDNNQKESEAINSLSPLQKKDFLNCVVSHAQALKARRERSLIPQGVGNAAVEIALSAGVHGVSRGCHLFSLKQFEGASSSRDIFSSPPALSCLASGEIVSRLGETLIKIGTPFVKKYWKRCWNWLQGQQDQEEMELYPEEIELYRTAATEGSPEAQFQLGLLYEKTSNLQKAIKWFRYATQRGHLGAQYRLGLCYSQARGKNAQHGKVLIERAARRGHPEAKAFLKL